MSVDQGEIDAAIESCRRWVRRRYKRQHYCEDLEQEAAIGVLRAAEDYDPARTSRFLTYARWWAWAKSGRASEYERAHHYGVTQAELVGRDSIKRRPVLHYDHPLPGQPEGTEAWDTMGDDAPSAHEMAEASEVASIVLAAAETCKDRLRRQREGRGYPIAIPPEVYDRIADSWLSGVTENNSDLAREYGVSREAVLRYTRQLRAEVRAALEVRDGTTLETD